MNLPGPYATMVLASLGAEVIKIEPPRGDSARHIGRLFDLVNAGKKSVSVDLKSPAGVAELKPLLASADVVVEGFRPGIMANFGLDADSLRDKHPRLVYCSVSGFGQVGPYTQYPAHDLNLQAITGVCHMMRGSDGHPWGCALPIADLSSGMTAVTTILAALLQRERTGRGQALDVALCDTVLSWAYLWDRGLDATEARLSEVVTPVNAWLKKSHQGTPRPVLDRIARFLDDAQTPDRLDRVGERLKRTRAFGQFARMRLHALPHYGVYRTRDDQWLSIGIVDEDKFWRALCRGLGLPAGLASIPGVGRVVAGGPLRRVVARALRRRTQAEWLEHFDRANVPVTPVLPLSKALSDPQLMTRATGAYGAAVPGALGSLARAQGPGLAPRLGEHNAQLLGG